MSEETADERISRLLIASIMQADRAYEAAGAASTKTYVNGFLLPVLELNGLQITELTSGERRDG